MSEGMSVETPVATKEKKGITGTVLKIIALLAMLIDHTAAIFLNYYLLSVIPTSLPEEEIQAWYMEHPDVSLLSMLYGLMRLIGRFGFPLFAFLIVEGFVHTRSVKKYAINLGIFALISELPFNLGLSSNLFFPYYQNVFFTLLLGLLCLAGMKYAKEKLGDSDAYKLLFYGTAFLTGGIGSFVLFRNFLPFKLIVLDKMVYWIIYGASALACLLVSFVIGEMLGAAKRNALISLLLPLVLCAGMADLIITDYGGAGVLTIVIMYLFREKKVKAFALGCAVLTVMEPIEAAAFFMLIPIALYNGKRGRSINKYVFYAFYPVHIFLLYLLSFLLGVTGFQLGF